MRNLVSCLIIFILAFCACLFYWRFYTPQELTFSDGAHYALVARQLYQSNSWTTKFSFYNPNTVRQAFANNVFAATLLPLTSLPIWLAFKIFGISDFVAILPSVLFFSASAVLIFLISKKISTQYIAWLASLIFIFNIHFLNYATSAASEPLFTFLLLASLLLLNSRRAAILAIIPLVIAFFTRQHAFFYLPAFFILLLLRFNRRDKIRIILVFLILIFSIYLVWTYHKDWAVFRYLPITQAQVLFASSQLSPANTALRSGYQIHHLSILSNLKIIYVKIFYNSYNLLKLLPQIFPPYLIPFVALSFLIPVPGNLPFFFGLSFVFNFLAVAASVPSYRYLHPLLPLIIILGTFVFFRIGKKINLSIIKTFILGLVLFVSIPLSSLILDSRFIAKNHHIGKPSSVKILGQKLGELTPPDGTIITNLDVWGSWYGDRTTIWFPLDPEQIDEAVKDLPENPIDYIYITSYRDSDENLFVGPEWQSLLKNPPTITNSYLNDNYTIYKTVKIEPADNYENIPLTATILKKK